MTHRSIPENYVRTETLEFCYNESFEGTVGDIANKYNVGVEVIEGPEEVKHFWPVVRIVGPKDNVLKCVEIQWDNGGDCMKCFALMMIQEPGYEAKWNTGKCEHKAGDTVNELLDTVLQSDPWGHDPKFDQDYPKV